MERNKERNDKIVELHMRGVSYREIGKQVGVCAQRAKDIFTRRTRSLRKDLDIPSRYWDLAVKNGIKSINQLRESLEKGCYLKGAGKGVAKGLSEIYDREVYANIYSNFVIFADKRDPSKNNKRVRVALLMNDMTIHDFCNMEGINKSNFSMWIKDELPEEEQDKIIEKIKEYSRRKKMELNSSNYFSREADLKYFSASQVKSFRKCEAATMAALRGEYQRPMSTALTVGQYVDEALTGDLEAWFPNHPEILKRDGTLKADYEGARLMVERARRDPLFMDFMDGEHQTILTAKLFGVPFKAKFDVLGADRIVDLKTVKDLKSQYLPGQGRVDFATAWDWPLQLAIYQKIYEINEGVKLPCYLAVITKETPADIRIIQVEQERMDAELALLEQQLPRFEAVKSGVIDPERCDRCEYCRESRILTGPELLGDFDEMGGISE